MKFRTELNPIPLVDFISYKTKMLAIGSCFADEIGHKLAALKFQISVNPYGVIFNPVSIATLLDGSDFLDSNLFVERDSVFYHHALHSEIHATSKSEFEEKVKTISTEVQTQICNGDMLLISLGTAWAYKHLETGKLVANCHKVNQKEFEKLLLDLDELKQRYHSIFTKLFKQNSKLKIMLTISPVRHSKDGLHENNLSKSVLMLLCDYLVQQFEEVFYFPAYELVIDDLRDYRFYKKDLVHPSEQAVEYVFEKFRESYFSKETNTCVAVRKDILALQNHRQSGIQPSDLIEKKIQKLEEEFASNVLKSN